MEFCDKTGFHKKETGVKGQQLRSSHRRSSIKKAILKNSQYSHDSTLKILIIHRNYIKKTLKHRCFPVKIAKSLLTPVFKDICKRLLLPIYRYMLNDYIFVNDVLI